MKILSVIGTRPQFIKAAILSPKIREQHEEIIVHTGQHYSKEMSELFFRELKIAEPEYNLNVHSFEHADMTALMMSKLDLVLLKERPDIVLLYGDCDTTLASAITASKRQLKIAHVEAGVRMRDRSPEEINRLVTDHLSSLLFAPSSHCAENLHTENVAGWVEITGDIMYDSFLKYASPKSSLPRRPRGFCYATIHRPENTDNPFALKEILQALAHIDIPVHFHVHPRTAQRIEDFGLNILTKVKIKPPIGYIESLQKTMDSRLVITDSGGLQREAYFANVPCVVIGSNLAWQELKGWNVLVPANTKTILTATTRLLSEKPKAFVKNLLGDGHACERIVKAL